MDSSRLPKQLLFSELTKTHPRHGPKRRWRDLAVMDVRALGIKENWYKIAQDRKQWLNVCEQIRASNYEGGLCAANRPSLAETFLCSCGRSFGCPGDLTRHQNFCSGIQHQDSGHLDSPNFHCSCGRTFYRKGDLTRHSHFCKAIFDLVSLVIIYRGLPQGYCYHLRMGSYRLRVCVCVCVCVSLLLRLLKPFT